MTNNILVTGAGGFIGSHLTRALKENKRLTIFPLLRRDLELRDRRGVAVMIQKIRPHVVIHLAGSMLRGDGETPEQKQKEDTFEAGRNVVEESLQAGIRNLIIAGSIDELGGQAGILKTDLTPQPISTYGRYKSLLNEFAQTAVRHSTTCIDWFRPFTVYGPGQVGQMLIPYAFASALSGRTAYFSEGKQKRDFLYIDDLIRWLLSLVKQVGETDLPGTFKVHHVGTGVGMAVSHVVQMIRGEFPEADFRLGTRQNSPGEPEIQVAPRIEGWQAIVDAEEGLRKTAVWWRSRVGEL